MTSRIARLRGAGLLALVFVTLTATTARGDDGGWVGTWSASPRLTERAASADLARFEK